MKKFIYTALFMLTSICFVANSFAIPLKQTSITEPDLVELYKHLTNNIKYPHKAHDKNLQGNSIVLFSIVNGKLQDVNIATELGEGCDVEVLNNVLNFANYKSLKQGKYALKTTFALSGSKTAIVNEEATIPTGYTPLHITIMAYATKIASGNGLLKKDAVNPIKTSGINLENPILYVLDGEIVASTSFNNLLPETIESITVLKDLAAIALYGATAKDGVIVITTKANAHLKNEEENKLKTSETGKNKVNFLLNEVYEPLIILNEEIYTGSIDSIKTADIAKFIVLKDFNAIATYGDKGKNGVIEIYTKKFEDEKKTTQKPKP